LFASVFYDDGIADHADFLKEVKIAENNPLFKNADQYVQAIGKI
jgi:hypothetical protein